MWTLFKIVNFVWLMSSTYMWLTTALPLTPIVFMVNVAMVVCMSFLPVKIEFTRRVGCVLAALTLVVIWEVHCNGYVMGIYSMMCYLPALYLTMLPDDYLRDLLRTTTKWYAILLIPALLLYGVTLFVTLPSFGQFVHPNYKPYLNYIFFIKTTFDYGTLVRFNAFFLEPGHQALLSSFIMMANRFQFRKCPWLFVLLVSVAFSFSLAGYLLAAFGFGTLYINSMKRFLLAVGAVAALVIVAENWYAGDNALNELIVSRLEYDEEKGIKGNNRFTSDTDYVYERSVERGDSWYGVKERTNMELIAGAGFKIYVISYGFIGVILVLLFYLSLIPSEPDYKYTIAFLLLLSLCFIQRAYPAWYSWLFTYVTGIYIARADKEARDNQM